LGPGLLESVYEVCLSEELSLRGVEHLTQVPIPVVYKGKPLDANFKIDVLIPDKLIVELKAVERLLAVHEAQLLTYLRLTKVKVGLLMNFNVPVLKDGVKRFVL
jgi:GxxExxY protein